MRATKTTQFYLCILSLGLYLALMDRATAQEIRVESNVVANPPGGGWHPWYEIHADPENGGNLIICGSKWNAKDNASYGFVYSSSDGGKTWHQALEDKNS